mmetsp:Transcript_116408/g.362595  ORF Transcript_116408/g.362595 Transcript_116408/m.362595 type:complete len:203 (-) Transcript_116408:474-1082(-)
MPVRQGRRRGAVGGAGGEGATVAERGRRRRWPHQRRLCHGAHGLHSSGRAAHLPAPARAHLGSPRGVGQLRAVQAEPRPRPGPARLHAEALGAQARGAGPPRPGHGGHEPAPEAGIWQSHPVWHLGVERGHAAGAPRAVLGAGKVPERQAPDRRLPPREGPGGRLRHRRLRRSQHEWTSSDRACGEPAGRLPREAAEQRGAL